MKSRKTLVGDIDHDVLAFTVGKDPALDLALVEADCIGSAAHAIMLSRVPVAPPLLSARDAARVIKALRGIIRDAREGHVTISQQDQDVHLAVERILTQRLGDLGKKIHTARSRNDQVAVDLRLFAKGEMLCIMDEAMSCAATLLAFARRHARLPMVGRTHMQPAMPSTVGVWASAYAESLLDDMRFLQGSYDVNDQCPLGSAAGYGVPLPIDRQLTARLLGFRAPIHNVMHASNARGKCESMILAALAQIMLTLARLAEDLLLFSMPEFAYFALPAGYCTGSSIMPQKRNPDVLELVRAKSARVHGYAATVTMIVGNLPGGYSRDLQDTKEPFLEGLRTTRACLRIMASLVQGLTPNRTALLAGFTPAVFATDRALELVAGGMPFRDAYQHVRSHLDELRVSNVAAALARKTHLGAAAGLDWRMPASRVRAVNAFVKRERKHHERSIARLLGAPYPNV